MSKIRTRALRKNPTEAERALWKHIRLRQLEGYKFRRQQQLGRYIVEFVCFEKKLVIELDGGQHAEQAASDSERSTWLESQGFRVLRFWNHDVLKNLEAVAEATRAALRGEGPPTQALPHEGGRGSSAHARDPVICICGSAVSTEPRPER
jgi:very-short-patch-repair endonuclease